MDRALMKVTIVVAVSETGIIECVPIKIADKFVRDKQTDKLLWQISYLESYVPVLKRSIVEPKKSEPKPVAWIDSHNNLELDYFMEPELKTGGFWTPLYRKEAI